ncbi:hypothetical protein ACLX1H_011278 [Fusarium chlamydosporum]
MGNLTLPEGLFFTASPEIRIKCEKAYDQLVRNTMNQEHQIGNKGFYMDCFLRRASPDERDGHLARLEGVQRMDVFIRDISTKASDVTLLQHNKSVGWAVPPNAHPCDMLAYNDKWRRLKFGQKQPEKGEYGYSECLYCNGTYDKVVEEKLKRKPSGVYIVHGPWTEGLNVTA